MRRLNRTIVLAKIKEFGTITKPELCVLTNLKAPTINNIVYQLEKDNLIKCIGKKNSTSKGGPRPNLYTINSEGGYFIGIDVGILKIIGVLVDLNGNILATESINRGLSIPKTFAHQLKNSVQLLLKKTGIFADDLVKIGISIAALIDSKTGIIASAGTDEFRNFDVAHALYPDVEVEIYVDNDINMLAHGQTILIKKIRDMNNVICIGIREGIGLGIIINGDIYRGSNGLAGNLQGLHNAIDGENILNQVRCALTKNPQIDTFCDKNVEDMSKEELFEVIRNNDQIAGAVESSFCEIGKLIGMLVQILAPDAVLVAGEIFTCNKRFFQILVDSCKASIFTKPAPKTEYYEVPLAANTLAYCSALYILDEFCKCGGNKITKKKKTSSTLLI